MFKDSCKMLLMRMLITILHGYRIRCLRYIIPWPFHRSWNKLFTAVALLLPSALNASIRSDADSAYYNDSLKVYQTIRQIAGKHKLTRLLYHAVFIDPQKPESQSKSIDAAAPPNTDIGRSSYTAYKGKKIRNIQIITLDPFGTDVNHPEQPPEKYVYQLGNQLHLKSRQIIIRDLLLFKNGDALDPFKITESERIIRQASYARDAKIMVYPADSSVTDSIPSLSGTPGDSVDIIVVERDAWSLISSGDITDNRTRLDLTEQNFLGSGQALENHLAYNFYNKPTYQLNGHYGISNIDHTFISANVAYTTFFPQGMQSISLARAFFSPLTQWAGGIDLLRNYTISNTAVFAGELKYNTQDYWLGKSFPANRQNNRIALAGRFYTINYNERPDQTPVNKDIDMGQLYANTELYLGSIAYSSRSYYKDKNIFRFGVTEDVPEGKLVVLTGGIENKTFSRRLYYSLQSSAGHHIEGIGHLSFGAECGSYLNVWKAQQGVLNADAIYFSDLWNTGRWGMRQFVFLRFSEGFDRNDNEFFYLSPSHELFGNNAEQLTGTQKLLWRIHQVFYLPYRVTGFRFAPFLFAGFGMIGSDVSPLLKSMIYESYGIGLLIRNENLVINTISISFALYPPVSVVNNPFYQLNPLGTYDVRFRDYALSKPGVINFY